MKVIKKGRKISLLEWIRHRNGKITKHTMQVTCKVCEATLEITSDDLREVPIFPHTITMYRYKCSECHCFNTITSRDLTEEICRDLSK